MLNILKRIQNKTKSLFKTILDHTVAFAKARPWRGWVKDPIFWVRFSAYAIPLAFLLYVLYVNFLPFGYNKTFVIEVGGPDDTKVSEFYLEPSPSLSDRMVAEDGTTYRELNGYAFAVFKPKAILKDATITVSVEGLEGEENSISIIPPTINLDPETVEWDYSWNFSENIKNNITPHQGVYQGQTLAKDEQGQITTHGAKNQGQTLATGVEAVLRGNAFVFDGEMTFNGRDTRLELPNSADKFEDGPFTIYAEWETRDGENNAQQIVGHYNWELWQNKESVEFRVGRMNDAQGPSYSISYKIEDTDTFFNKKHTAVAIYNPADNGYIDLYVDGNLAGRTYFGADKIWKNYGKENLSLGWTPHNYQKSPYLSGVIHNINIISKNILSANSEINFKAIDIDSKDISILSLSTSTLKYIKLNVSKK